MRGSRRVLRKDFVYAYEPRVLRKRLTVGARYPQRATLRYASGVGFDASVAECLRDRARVPNSSTDARKALSTRLRAGFFSDIPVRPIAKRRELGKQRTTSFTTSAHYKIFYEREQKRGDTENF